MVGGLPLKKMTTSGPGIPSNSLFTKYFSLLKEPRRTKNGNFQYPLEEILFLTISSMISGCMAVSEILRKK